MSQSVFFISPGKGINSYSNSIEKGLPGCDVQMHCVCVCVAGRQSVGQRESLMLSAVATCVRCSN